MKPRLTLPRLPDDDEKLGNEPSAKFIGMSPRTLEGMRLKGTGPRFFKISRKKIVYSKRQLREWLADRERRSTSDPGRRTRPASASARTRSARPVR